MLPFFLLFTHRRLKDGSYEICPVSCGCNDKLQTATLTPFGKIVIFCVKIQRVMEIRVLKQRLRHAVAQLAEAPGYNPEGRGFNSRRVNWDFSPT